MRFLLASLTLEEEWRCKGCDLRDPLAKVIWLHTNTCPAARALPPGESELVSQTIVLHVICERNAEACEE